MTLRTKAPKSEESKHPDSDVWYELSWASHLAGKSGSVTLSSVVWTVPTGLTKENELIGGSSTIAQIQLSGGTDGQSYLLICTVTLSNGETEVGYLRVTCSDAVNYSS